MKFLSRFGIGEAVISDYSACYYALVNCDNGHGDNVTKEFQLEGDGHLIGVTLKPSTVECIYFSASVDEKGKTDSSVGYALSDYGTSGRDEGEKYGRGTWKTQEEATYFANKAYLKRLLANIKRYEKSISDADDITPSRLHQLQTSLSKLILLKERIETTLQIVPKVDKRKFFRCESKYNLGDKVWIFPSSEHHGYSIGDICEYNCIEYANGIIKKLKDKPKQIKITGIRNWNSNLNNPIFLYSHDNQGIGGEYHESNVFATKKLAKEYGKQSTFIWRNQASKAELQKQCHDTLVTLSTGDISPKMKRKIEQKIIQLDAAFKS